MRNGCSFFCAVVVILLGFSAPVLSADKYITNNGITVIYQQDKSSLMTHAVAFIKGGNCEEKKGQVGITTFLQRMLLKGTDGRSADQIAEGIESLGGSLGADLSNDFLQISLTVPTRYFREGFGIFADVIRNPAFPENEVEKERKVLLADIKARYDEIFPYTYDYFLMTMYETLPYGNLILGDREDVRALTRQDIIQYYSGFCAPNNIVLVVLTGIPVTDIKKRIDAEFGDMLPRDRNWAGSWEVPERGEPARITAGRGFKQAFLMVGFAAPEVSSDDYPVMKLVNNIIGEGGSSRAFVRLREKEGLAYEVGSFYPSRKNTSHFVVYMGLAPENISTSREEILDILDSVSTLSDDELSDAKSYLIGKFILDHESPQRRAWYLGWYEIMGKGYGYDEKYPQEIAGVKKEDIEKAAAAYFGKDNWVCVEVVPQK